MKLTVQRKGTLPSNQSMEEGMTAIVEETKVIALETETSRKNLILKEIVVVIEEITVAIMISKKVATKEGRILVMGRRKMTSEEMELVFVVIKIVVIKIEETNTEETMLSSEVVITGKKMKKEAITILEVIETKVVNQKTKIGEGDLLIKAIVSMAEEIMIEILMTVEIMTEMVVMVSRKTLKNQVNIEGTTIMIPKETKTKDLTTVKTVMERLWKIFMMHQKVM